MIITQAYKYTENNAMLFFPESSKILLSNDEPQLMQGELVDVICEVQGDYTSMYEPSTAPERLEYLQSEVDLFDSQDAANKIIQINNLIQ
jgi:hypothetical protein